MQSYSLERVIVCRVSVCVCVYNILVLYCTVLYKAHDKSSGLLLPEGGSESLQRIPTTTTTLTTRRRSSPYRNDLSRRQQQQQQQQQQEEEWLSIFLYFLLRRQSIIDACSVAFVMFLLLLLLTPLTHRCIGIHSIFLQKYAK